MAIARASAIRLHDIDRCLIALMGIFALGSRLAPRCAGRRPGAYDPVLASGIQVKALAT
jgi:hypothetical protein